MTNDAIRVLSIEDNPAEAQLIQDELAEAQRISWDLPYFTVEHVDRLETALARLEENEFDVVLTDLDLTDSKAEETFATLRKQVPHTPIVVLTGREDEELARRSVRAGAQDYLYKEEVTGSLLARTLMYAIERQEIHDQLEQRVAERTAELRQANKALQEREEQYRILFESFPLGITVADSAGQIMETNQESERLLGIMQDEHERRQIDGEEWRIIRPDGSLMPTEEYASVRALQEGRLVENVEMGIVKPGGEITWINVTAAPLWEDRVVITYNDITERRQAEHALRESKRRFESLFDAMIEGVALHKMIYDEAGHPIDYVILEINHAYELQTGIAREAAVGKRASEVYNLDEPPYLDRYGRVTATGQPINFEVYFPPLRRHFRISAFSPAEGQFATVFEDITKPKQREQRLLLQSQMLDAAGQAIIATDPSGTIIYWNEAAETFYGWAKEEMIGHNIVDIIPATETQKDAVAIMKRLRSGERWTGEFTVRRRNGETRQVIVTDTPIHDEEGELIAIIGVTTDITERKQIEEAIQQSEEKYRRLVEGSPDILYIYSDQRGALYWSRRVQEILGYAPADLVENPYLWHDAIHPDDVAAVDDAIAASEKGADFEIEYRIQDASGNWHWFHDRFISKRCIEGECIIEGLATDITERKQIEEALHKSEAELTAIIEGAPFVMMVLDREWRVRKFKDRNREFIDAPPANVLGFRCGAVLHCIHADDVPEGCGFSYVCEECPLRGIVLDTIETGRSHHAVEVPMIFAHQDTVEERTLQAYTTPLEMDDERQSLLVLQDITEHQQAEKALRQYMNRLRIQHEIDRAILRAQSPEEVARATLERLHLLLPCRQVSIAEVHPSQQQGRDMIILVDGQEKPGTRYWHPLINAGQPLIEVIQQGQPYVIHDLASLDTLTQLEEALVTAGIRSYISMPLLVQETLLGTLNLASETPHFLQSHHLDILKEVADSLAIAFQQARLLEQTRHDAQTRALLLREVNHRVKNNLDAIIGLLYVERRHAPPEALPAYGPIMQDLTQRIMGLAEVHRMLSEVEWAPLNLSELAGKIIQTAVQGTDAEARVEIDVAPSSVRVGSAQAHHLALVLSELTTNTLKHAVVGRERVRISVQITEKDSTITLCYRNDGPGYAEDVLSLKRHNAGLDIVKRTVRKNLRGELILRNDGGAVTEIRFKNNLHDEENNGSEDEDAKG
ncbi:MAG: PAS domain S-box protein, partial [Anaerolineae bacterium]